MLLLISALLATTPGQTVTLPAHSATATVENRPVLWRELRLGMTPDEVAAKLREVQGIKSATVKVPKKGKKGEPSVSIDYVAPGVTILELPQTVTPVFADSKLQSVSFGSTACLSLAIQKFKDLKAMLAEKYGPDVTKKEVTEDRQLIGIRSTYATTPTRVLLRIEQGATPQHVYGGSGKVANILGQIANSSVDAEIEACPNDAGTKGIIEIIYLDNAISAQAEAQERAVQDAARAKEKDKL